MVEQDPAGSVHAIAFAVVDRYAMGKDFGTAIGTTRVEPGILVLRGRYASEHLAGRGLIKPAPDSRSLDGFQQSNGTQRNHVRGVFGNFEAHFDVALRAQVVRLVRAYVRQTPCQRAGVAQVRVVKEELYSGFVKFLIEMIDALRIEGRGPPLQTVDLVTFRTQKLG